MGNNEMSITIRNIEYKIIQILGEGGYGRVIQVKSKLNKKYYAIKEIIINNEMENKINISNKN